MSSSKKKKYDQTGVPEAYRVPIPSEGEQESSSESRPRLFPPAPDPLVAPIVDNHCHLDFREDDENRRISLKDVMDAAEAVGVVGAVQVGWDLNTSRFTIDAITEEPRLLGAVAMHPNEAAALEAEKGREGLDEALDEIFALAEHPRVRALGETGLDYYRTGPEGVEAQKYSFYRHLARAAELGKALQIHDRDAHDDVVEVLNTAPELPEHVVFHCYSGGVELAEICNERGWYMSFAGTVTFNANEELRAAAAVARPELILVETDSPFLTPHPRRGRSNAPYMTPWTLRKIAEVREVSEAEMAHIVKENTHRVYGDFD